MSTFLIVASIVAVISGWICGALLLFGIYYRLIRAKGYTGPVPALMVVAVTVSLSAAALVVLKISSRENETWFVLIDLMLPLLCAVVVTYVWARMLPRKARLAGPRQACFPFVAVGSAAFILGLAQLIWVIASHRHFLSASLKLFIYGAVPLGLFCFYMSKRVKETSAEELLQEDPRPPVLYLRAFATEETTFITLPASKALSYSSNYTFLLQGQTKITFEQYFGNAIRELVGPFIALGNPWDYLPPEGAARTYQRDENWTETFLALARPAACILIQVGDSQNLRWELGALKSEALMQKVFVFTSPRKESRINRMESWIKGIRNVSWAEFVDEMGASGYQLATTKPSPGSIFGFDPDGAAILLASNAQQPTDYLGAVTERLQGVVPLTRRA